MKREGEKRLGITQRRKSVSGRKRGGICWERSVLLWAGSSLRGASILYSLSRIVTPSQGFLILPRNIFLSFLYFLFFLFHFLSCISSPQSLFPKMITSHPAICPISTEQSPRVSIRNWSPSDSSPRKLNTLQVQYNSCVSGFLQIVRILN